MNKIIKKETTKRNISKKMTAGATAGAIVGGVTIPNVIGGMGLSLMGTAVAVPAIATAALFAGIGALIGAASGLSDIE